ncbi:alanine--tRNA ligase [Chloroflexia bacterium SDU3-3]|nr:alanine--tRNA ligase [Chloroflexia bacterium SDU3-3]
MKKLSTAEIRATYLRFFEQRGHTVVPSAPLVPGNDPTLLFNNAGMVPFKDTFLGLEQRPYTRATSAQKCLRVSGKHNDLEEVGPSPRHQTFFEMLGNFSFGDYFKADAIQLAWDLLTKELELPVERLWFTVFGGNDLVPADEEAEQLWLKVGASPDRILRFGEKDNFWVMGDTGPCGPCSEITVYLGEDLSRMRADGVNSDDPDYVEIWNNVFMQFDRETMQPIPKPSIDTGMGLERIAMVMQGVKATYDTDAFTPIIGKTIALLGSDERHYRANFAPYRAVADHARAVAFLMSEGIQPGNTGRNYVLRRLLRRAVYQGRTIGFEKPFLAEVVGTVIDEMGGHYKDLRERRDFILETTDTEERQFLRTLSGGVVRLNAVIEQTKASGGDTLSGVDAFTLKDTYGFPLDLTQRIAAEQSLQVDEAGYDAEMEKQRERGRQAAQFKRGADAEIWADQELPASEFTGYEATADHGRVLAITAAGDVLRHAQEGQQVQIVLHRTPFYAESGGQMGDTGTLATAAALVRVTDTQRPIPGVIVHHGVVERGSIGVGDEVEARVDTLRRRDIMRNHTATHLLHKALRESLGEHATQAGSLVSPEKLRFDFNHNKPLTQEQLRSLEAHVNAWIRADAPVSWEQKSYQEALDSGAMALFGEKYGDRVRMVTVGCGDRELEVDAPVATCSRELCGGIHVGRTGEIGAFTILGESGVAAGVRRIEAVTGRGAEALAEQQSATVKELSAKLGVPTAKVAERVDGLLAELKQRQRELDALKSQQARGSLDGLLEKAQSLNGFRLVTARVEAEDNNGLREMGDWLRDKISSGVIVLGAVLNEKPAVLAVVTPDLVKQGYHAGNLVKALAPIMGGGGGGRPDMAQAGGREIEKLDTALAEAASLVAAQKR